ncbi:MAG: DUF2791 family P-loop domain-containing protein [Acidobacteria bacterium]|nr:DUF2791 family P-loop domain-containing protein [Acidobacteriota bacterium]
MSPDAIKKVLGWVTRTLTALAKAAKADPGQAFSARNKAIVALRDLDTRLDGWLRDLDAEQAAHARQRETALDRRRDDLARSAMDVDWTVRRRREYDVVDCFRVDYTKNRVTVQLGSEKLDAFDEADGRRLFARLRTAREELDQVPFDRLEFLQTLKDAIGLAETMKQDRNGKVPIRKLYPMVVLARQLRNERFLRKPDSKTYADYPMTPVRLRFRPVRTRGLEDGTRGTDLQPAAQYGNRRQARERNAARARRARHRRRAARLDLDRTEPFRVNPLEILAHLAEVGTPPTGGADVIRVSAGLRSTLERIARETLPFVAAGGSDLQFVFGPYGRGKTHYLKALAQWGREHGFVTAYVDGQDNQSPFRELDQTYRAIAGRMAPPSTSETRPLFGASGVAKVVEASFIGRDRAGRREVVDRIQDDRALAPDFSQSGSGLLYASCPGGR